MRTISISGYMTLWILLATFILSTTWYVFAPNISKAETPKEELPTVSEKPQRTGRYVLINLDQMTLALQEGATTLAILSIISQGKPGSYYETIGGNYTYDYREALHFSSIGHVYMPYSVHVFGNFFIHGIPYYPDGTKVDTTYSGGCVRLSDQDAKRVYDFVSTGTPIIITRGAKDDFSPTATTSPIMESVEMTRLMVALVSLEFLTQDDTIVDPESEKETTRRALIARLLAGDEKVNALYAKSLGEKAFLKAMTMKALALGLTNTTFLDTTHAALTTPEDYARFMDHITTYKSYLKTQENLTPSTDL